MKRILLSLLLGLSSTAVLADVAVPEKAAACAACHGDAGAKPIMPAYPVLAGQYANYLEHAMHEYQDGRRKNAIMSAQMSGLSKADIRALARYFAAQKGSLYTPSLSGTQPPQP